MSDTANAAQKMKPRPTSPHLSIYRWQITMSLSILHRMTGIAMSVGLVMLTWWLLAILFGPAAYDCFVTFAKSIVGRVFLIGWSWAMFFHMLNGIRHLFWDIGKGYEIQSFTQSGIMVVLGSLVLTVLLWVLALTSAPQIAGGFHG